MTAVTQHAERRRNNERIAAAIPTADDQGVVEFGCECAKSDCARSVAIPLYVFRRIVDARGQCVVQTGHHAFPNYRTIIRVGLMTIEERV
jgi:hypothetical protein